MVGRMGHKSPWSSTPRRKRKRKPLSVTLSDRERELLEMLAHECGPTALSRLVAAAIHEFSHLSPERQRDALDQAERMSSGAGSAAKTAKKTGKRRRA